MDSLPLEFSSPKAFILAARGNTASFSRDKDQVWELEFSEHDVHPISLHTSFGLRAREMRLFPSFTINNKQITGLRDYFSPPSVTRYLPDSFRVQSAPGNGLDVQWEGYFPDPETIIGTLMMTNHTSESVAATLELAATLVPMRKGTPMHPDKDGINQIISGQSGDLCPVLFMTGGPNAVVSHFPALVVPLQLEPGQTRRLTWALVSKDNAEESLAAARRISAFDWKATVREKALKQARQTIQIRTGDPDWDAAFFLSQVQAQVHYLGSENGRPPGYLRSRLPDETTSSGNGGPFTDDLTVLEARHLFQVLPVYGSAALANILNAFLSRITEDGVLPSQLFSTVRNNPIRECPLLTELYLILYETDQDLSRLEKAFSALCRLFDRWFRHEKGLDDGQPPVWDDPRQCQCGTGLFHFDIWEETGRGMDIGWAKSPALLAMLSNEAAALSRIAKLLKDRSSQKKYSEISKSLHQQIQATWNERAQTFCYQDLDSCQSPDRELYFPGRVQPELKINKVFLQPQRLQLHLTSSDENTRVCRLTIDGTDTEGNTIQEIIKNHQLRWVMGRAHVTTTHCFGSIESLFIEGLKAGDRFLLETADFSQPDITCLLPLWSGDVTDDQGKILVENLLDPEAENHSLGIPETWEAGHDLPKSLSIETDILWNTLIIEGLMKNGYQEIAAVYFSRMMAATLKGLRHFSGFFMSFSVESGQPTGPRNALAGLVPVQLFLSLAGIRVFSPHKVAVWGRNPFPWPVEVHWQGLSVWRNGADTLVTFPDGTRYEKTSEKPAILAMKSE